MATVFWGSFHGIIGLILIVAFMPLDHTKRAAIYGWFVGLGYFGWTLRWIIEPFLVDVARHGWMAPFALLLMAGGLALFWALGFGVARALGRRNGAVAWLPITLSATELVRGHVLSGFPWGLPSYTLIGGPADIWLAWVGSYGATFLMLAFACAIVFCRVSKLENGNACDRRFDLRNDWSDRCDGYHPSGWRKDRAPYPAQCAPASEMGPRLDARVL